MTTDRARLVSSPPTNGSTSNGRGPAASGRPSRAGPRRRTIGVGFALAVLAIGLVLSFAPAPAASPTSSPSHAPVGPAPLTQTPGSPAQGCDGMYWAQGIGGWYQPTWCYGHDEPTISYVSNAPHSGEDASFQVVLPADTALMPQGNLYATFWFGGVVADVNSTAGGGAAFLELQFYPSPPAFTGSGSGTQDCLPNGAFNYVWTPGSNDWFVCAIVWQLTGNSASPTEDAAIATPLNLAGGSNQIFEMHSGDRVYVNYSGVAQTSPWNLHVTDLTSAQSGTVVLQNGTLVLSPYYTTAAASNALGWSASGAGAIAFAYEVGHSLNPAVITNPVNGGCTPGDLNCYSYWPGKWSQSGQNVLALPVLGTGTEATYPTSIGLSSSQGGETEVNQSACVQPSFSTLRNCMYPFFIYRSGSYGFTMDADLSVANITHDYGNEYQFPGDISTPAAALSSDPHHTVAAPWGSVTVYTDPSTATVQVNPPGSVNPIASSGGTATGQFMEGAYWVNVSAPGCASFSESAYVGTGSDLQIPVVLNCGAPATLAVATSPASGNAPLPVSFLGAANGGVAPYSFTWAFGDGTFATGASATHTFGSAGTYAVTLTARDAVGHTSSAGVSVYVLPPPPLLTVSQPVALYAHDVSTLASGGIQSFPLSTAFPTGEPDFNSFYVVPVAGPSSWTFSLPNPTAAPIYLDPGTPIVANFFLSLPTSNSSTGPAAIPVTVAASLTAGVFVGQGAETLSLPVGGATVEYTITFGAQAGTVSAGSPLTLTFSWYEASVGGVHLAWPIALHCGATYPIAVSLPTFDPIYLTPPVVTPTGSGVTVATNATSPYGAGDLARVTGALDGTATAPPTASGATYTFGFSPSTASPGTHTLVIRGYDLQGSYNVAVTEFAMGPQSYSLAFTESGLPSGTSWNVTLGASTSASSTTSTVGFSEPNGTYSFRVGGATGYVGFPSSGTVSVAGANVAVSIAFTSAAQAVTVTFHERGLPSGTSWSVDLSGEVASATSSGISFLVPGSTTYSFAVASVPGYSVSPSSGTVAVGSSPLTLTISFHHEAAHGGPGSHGAALGNAGSAAGPALLETGLRGPH